MQDLTPVGLSKDGRKLLLISSSGEEFAVPVNTRLRAALRGENARLGQLEMKMESALRPRDIQARIRAGESPEDVAAAAQTTVDAIMGFATPVLAERAHVATTALRASVRRRSNEAGHVRTLGEAADIYFSEHALHEEDVSWDAWRRADGRWALVATYAVEGRPRTAEFTHDLRGRYVVADNDEARVLTGEMRAPETRRPAAAGQAPAQGRRLSSVPSNDDELPLGDDALELVRDREEAAREAEPMAEPVSPPESRPVAEPASAPMSGPGSDRADDLTAGTADADWMAPAAPERREPQPRPEEPSVARPDAEEPDAEEPAAEEPAAEAPATQEPAEEQEPPRPASKKKGRSSVPSWDEIMFGGGKGD